MSSASYTRMASSNEDEDTSRAASSTPTRWFSPPLRGGGETHTEGEEVEGGEVVCDLGKNKTIQKLSKATDTRTQKEEGTYLTTK